MENPFDFEKLWKNDGLYQFVQQVAEDCLKRRLTLREINSVYDEIFNSLMYLLQGAIRHKAESNSPHGVSTGDSK